MLETALLLDKFDCPVEDAVGLAVGDEFGGSWMVFEPKLGLSTTAGSIVWLCPCGILASDR